MGIPTYPYISHDAYSQISNCRGDYLVQSHSFFPKEKPCAQEYSNLIPNSAPAIGAATAPVRNPLRPTSVSPLSITDFKKLVTILDVVPISQ